MEPEAQALTFDDLTTAMSGTDSEFWNQFVGSSSANVLLMLAVGAFLGIKKLCNRDSKCKSHLHCCCIEFDVRDKTIRDPPELTDDAPPGVV